MADKMYMITKVFSPRSEYNNKWLVESFIVGHLGMHINEEILFFADSRKECIIFAEENGYKIAFMDSGRRPCGAKW